MNILFVHPLEGNAYEIFKAFERNPLCKVYTLDEQQKKKNTIINKIRYKLKIPSDLNNYNYQLLQYNLNVIDYIFVIKGNELLPKTLQILKEKKHSLKLINFSLDDMYATHNRSLYYTYSLKWYDFVVTTKSFNVKELSILGAKKIVFLYQAYSKDIHYPQKCSNEFNYDVIFIGYPEKERIDSILYLADNDIKVHLYGYPEAWKKVSIKHENIILHEQFLFGKTYAEALSCAKISLCFLRKINRDLHTSRSIEIPACGGFMLAERTNEHLELFNEDEEAAYFENDKELLEKVKFYLKHDVERKNIANAGYKRCLASDYSYDNMVASILQEIL